MLIEDIVFPRKVLALTVLIGLIGCGNSSNSKDAETVTLPGVTGFGTGLFSSNSANIDNELFPLTPGKSYIYEGEEERIEVSVSHDTKTIMGIESVIVVDRAYEEDKLVEETFDWYAQDMNGNVWYMGEDSKEIEDGEVVSTEGSWISGGDVDNIGQNAEAGIIMKVPPHTVGDTYLQENYPTIAEDMAEIIALNVTVDGFQVILEDGSEVNSFTATKFKEWVPLDADPVETEEFKYFASGVGLVLETDAFDEERIELKSITDDKTPNISVDNFTNPTNVTNKYFPLVVGSTSTYQTTAGEDEEFILIEVLADAKMVMGINVVVVRDRVYIDGDQDTGILIEDTRDWFAQDDDSNVWYMGEDVDNFDEDTGDFVDNEGAWEAGVNGAQPGIQMKANPRIGDSYRQEYLEGEAEDLAAIVGIDVTVMLENGSSFQTLMVKEWNPLEEKSTEFKYFAENFGLVREEGLDEDGEVEEVIELE